MMGLRQIAQGQLFYEFPLEAMVPPDHLLRPMDRLVDLSAVRPLLASSYRSTGRSSVAPELMIRMLMVGYCYGIRSERRLCEEAGVNLTCRWFCHRDMTDPALDHSTFSKNRRLFGADASLITADASRYNMVQAEDWSAGENTSRAVQEYLDTLDDAAFGGVKTVQPKNALSQ